MSENRACGCDNTQRRIREAVCIDTDRVYDSCADKDCLADLRVYFTDRDQAIVDKATNVRCRGSEILNVFIEVERVPFNRGFYSVDITFFFKVTLDIFCGAVAAPTTVCGFTTFSKKCILYGSEGNVKVFSSEFAADEIDEQLAAKNTNPKAKVQTVDPICLEAKLCRPCDCCDAVTGVCLSVPKCVRRVFDGEFNECFRNRDKAVAVTLGIFTIVQLERDVQMLIPAYDFCIPEKECCCETDDPCDAFRKIKFPVDEFFPPRADRMDCCDNKMPDCGCC